MVYKACWMKDQGMDYQLESAMAKCLAADVAMKVTVDAVQVMGGYGYMKEYPVEKMMRDAKIMQIYEGTNQIPTPGYCEQDSLLNYRCLLPRKA